MKQIAIKIAAGFLVLLLGSCSRGQELPLVSARELPGGLGLEQLTPQELQRLERVVNSEVSPCGDDISLALALFDPQACPLAPLAINFVIQMIKNDYNEEEIAAAYLERYAAFKVPQVPIDGSPVRGATKPVLTLVVFTDFECPFCAKASTMVHELLRRYPDKLAVVHKHYPLSSHPHAEFASRAAHAAGKQDKFWELHDTLFSAAGSPLTKERVLIMAQGLGLEMEQLEEDLSSTAASAALTADRKLGQELGVTGTPTIFINGKQIESATKDLVERVKEELLRYSIKNQSANK